MALTTRERLKYAAVSTLVGAVFHDRLNRWRTTMTWRMFVGLHLAPGVILVLLREWAARRPGGT